jgi:enoyl-[acyl-carrier protein] reductase II
MNNRICHLLNITHPIIQGGMVWCSGWRLAHAVSSSGGLGVIGAGSMTPTLLTEHIGKIRASQINNFAVNIPLMNKHADAHIQTVIKNKVPIVITSAGNPSSFTQKLKESGIKVLHVVSSCKFAIKAEKSGVDAVIAEGFEAGGHNGREETTTLCLVPQIRKKCKLPLLAAGGIASGQSMFAVMSLGAEGVQVGSRYAVCQESSAHELFKQKVYSAEEGETILTLKELAPVRLLKNDFSQQISAAYADHWSTEALQKLLGKGRARMGIFEGDLQNGELEIGQVADQIQGLESAKEVTKDLIDGFHDTLHHMIKVGLKSF